MALSKEVKEVVKEWAGYSCAVDDVLQIIEDLEDAEILINEYSYEDYQGSAYVLYRKNRRLYEVHGSHCSCNRLEGQWSPERTSVGALKMRTWFPAGVELKDVLKAIKK